MGARVAVVTESTTELAGIGGNLDGLAGTTLERASESTALAESSVRFVDEVTQVVTALRETAERMRSEEHTSELQSLMRISYAVFCLQKKKITYIHITFYL